jgi:hypothetical protein
MEYLFVGAHPESLASGRPLVFGDLVDATELSEEDSYLADRLITPAPDQKSAPAPLPEATEPEPTTTEAK